MDTIDMMRAFSAVAMEGSFTRGAKRLGLTVQTTSKYVKLLEERLKVQLFDRTTRSVALNDTGKAYLDRCIAMIDQFDDMESTVKEKHQAPKGRIRMTAPTTIGENYLVPVLADFIKQHPDIHIELELTNRKVSLVEEGYDLGIRASKLEDSSLIARRLAPARIVVCASTEYLEKYGKPKHPENLNEHLCLVDTNFRHEHQWPFKIKGKDERVNISGPFQTNTPEAIRQMALEGVGIAMCAMYAVNQDIVAGRLHLLFEEYEAFDFSVYAIYPYQRHLSVRVRSLVEHLAANFRRI